VRQHEIQKNLLPGIEVGADRHFGARGALLTRQSRQRVGDERQ
jgi:hypothetical protein